MKAIIFDLDGTLIDSLTDIALCMNEVLEKLNYPTHDINKYNYFVGDGALVLTQNALPKNSSQEEINKVLEHFKELYDLGIHNNTKPYEGIRELLRALESSVLKVGILSNKPHAFTLKYAQKFFSDFTLEEVHGQKENVPKKPHPAGALDIANAFRLKPCEIVYVGDTATDIKTAKNAGMQSIGVLWGFRTKEELVENGADYIVETPQQIWDIIQKNQIVS